MDLGRAMFVCGGEVSAALMGAVWGCQEGYVGRRGACGAPRGMREARAGRGVCAPQTCVWPVLKTKILLFFF